MHAPRLYCTSNDNNTPAAVPFACSPPTLPRLQPATMADPSLADLFDLFGDHPPTADAAAAPGPPSYEQILAGLSTSLTIDPDPPLALAVAPDNNNISLPISTPVAATPIAPQSPFSDFKPFTAPQHHPFPAAQPPPTVNAIFDAMLGADATASAAASTPAAVQPAACIMRAAVANASALDRLFGDDDDPFLGATDALGAQFGQPPACPGRAADNSRGGIAAAAAGFFTAGLGDSVAATPAAMGDGAFQTDRLSLPGAGAAPFQSPHLNGGTPHPFQSPSPAVPSASASARVGGPSGYGSGGFSADSLGSDLGGPSAYGSSGFSTDAFGAAAASGGASASPSGSGNGNGFQSPHLTGCAGAGSSSSLRVHHSPGASAGSSSELTPAHSFPDPSVAISAAATLPEKPRPSEPLLTTLQSGLDAEAPSSDRPRGPNLLDIPPVKSFVEEVCKCSQYVAPEKLMTFLDGGDGATGILVNFRRLRSASLRERDPTRSSSSVSGSACVDGRYFARQIFLPMIAAALEDVVLTNPDSHVYFLPAEQQHDVRRFREILDAGGVEEVKRRIERESEEAGVAMQRLKLNEKRDEFLKHNDGAALTGTQEKRLRDAGSSAKSNEKRKKLYDLTRLQVMDVLIKRWELRNAFFEQIVQAGPSLQSSQQFAPVAEA